MSVIAWDGRTLAADRQGTKGDTIYSIRKLWKISFNIVIAVAGYPDSALVLKQWCEKGFVKQDWPSCQSDKDKWSTLVVVKKNNPVVFYETQPEPIEVIDNFMSWGIGREAALGAMAKGATAVEAVEIASKFVIGCGRGCDWEVI